MDCSWVREEDRMEINLEKCGRVRGDEVVESVSSGAEIGDRGRENILNENVSAPAERSDGGSVGTNSKEDTEGLANDFPSKSEEHGVSTQPSGGVMTADDGVHLLGCLQMDAPAMAVEGENGRDIQHPEAGVLVDAGDGITAQHHGGSRIQEGDADILQSELDSAKKSSTLEGGEETVASEGEGEGKALGTDPELENGDDEERVLSVAELVAKCRAPVKREFLNAVAVRLHVPNSGVIVSGLNNGVWDEKAEPRVLPEKISKRQLRKERLQAKKSGICVALAQTGDVKMCQYGLNCRYNHDLEGYLAQKPPDLPGRCPFLDSGGPCAYGFACRFANSHKEYDGDVKVLQKKPNITLNETNGLSKDLQKLLWKNMGSFPKADAQLNALGLMKKAFKTRKTDEEETKIPELGSALKDESLKDNGTQYGRESSLGTSATTAGERLEDLAVTRTLENKSDGPVLSHTEESFCPPQKRLRSETDELLGETKMEILRESGQPVDEPSKLDPVKLDLELRDTPSDIGDILAKDIVKSTHRKDSSESTYVESKLGVREKKLIDFRDKLYLAPLTTLGNLPFRRVCKALGADITCGEMAMCTNLLQGQLSEWALLRRHSSEDLFGVQICGGFPDHLARTAELIEQECAVDFIDINAGCPIDLVVNKGCGSCLLIKPQRLEHIVRATSAIMEKPLTLKVRMGYYEGRNCAHSLIPKLSEWGLNAVTIHGRTRQQRYRTLADWAYIQECVAAADDSVQVIGNGDVFSYTDWNEHLKQSGSMLSTCLIARGALVKPWLFTEIKEERHWDISSGERLDILRQYVNAGLQHWGSDSKGVETTRHFLLEWLSYLHRYIPVGLLEVVPQRLNWRQPSYFGRNDLETMMASESALDWVRISELLLGPTPPDFMFTPKHKANSYDKPENG